jgi:hypothetical protein
MDDHRLVAVSPRHYVRLASELWASIETPPARDFVVRTVERRVANGLPLMAAEIVIAGRETRDRHPLADAYPLHFKKTYAAARLHGDTAREYGGAARASELLGAAPPIGYSPDAFRSCLVPGTPYRRLSPFGVEPEEGNLRFARDQSLAVSAGLWRLLDEAFRRLRSLHDGGLAHGDAELSNFIVTPAPLEVVIVDFEAAVVKDEVTDGAWRERLDEDLGPLLREAVFLQCALGRQEGELAARAWEEAPRLFRDAERFQRAIVERSEMDPER